MEVIDAPPQRERTAVITGNFIHDNVQCNAGYGVVIDQRVPGFETTTTPGFARIDHNVFDFNRHDISAAGGGGPGYIAERNFTLNGGPTCDGNFNQHFDVHGEKQSDGGFDGGTAGTYFEIRHNTFHGAQSYGLEGRLVRPAFELRGTPTAQAIFANNAFPHVAAIDERTARGSVVTSHGAVLVKGASVSSLRKKNKLVIARNASCVDTAGELAVGDFDGDGRDDVFQAAGTVWVYSPSGRREWFMLGDSDLRLDHLGLGDFTGDGRTDVFIQQGDRWLLSNGGTGEPTPLPAGSEIDVKHYRFGDFDGDRRTDVFRANGSQFFYSSAGTTKWQPLAASRLGIGELRLGDFNGDGLTDIFSLANNQWSVSYGGNTSWRRLNGRLSSSLGSLVFADFDGDRKTDVGRSNDGKWQVSWGGATPWRTLQAERSEPLSFGMLYATSTATSAPTCSSTAPRRAVSPLREPPLKQPAPQLGQVQDRDRRNSSVRNLVVG